MDGQKKLNKYQSPISPPQHSVPAHLFPLNENPSFPESERVAPLSPRHSETWSPGPSFSLILFYLFPFLTPGL